MAREERVHMLVKANTRDKAKVLAQEMDLTIIQVIENLVNEKFNQVKGE